MVCAYGEWLPGRIWIERGVKEDYEKLARFHYVDKAPALVAGVWRAMYDDEEGGEAQVVGVGVVTYPTLSSTAREEAFSLAKERYDGEKIKWINQNLRNIARVVVHPKFRGAGLATEIVRKILRETPVRYIESFAMMGRAIPFLERAGMTRHRVVEEGKPFYYWWERKGGGDTGVTALALRETGEVSATKALPPHEPTVVSAPESAIVPVTVNRVRRGEGARGECPLNDDELHDWIKRKLGLHIPRVSVCAHHDAPFDYVRSAFFEPAKDVVVWAPRGGGKTRLGALATLLDLIFKPKCSIRILGGSLEQSMKMWEHLRDDAEMLREEYRIKIGAQRIEMPNGSVAAVISQSQKAVRGLRVQKLRCDEVEVFDDDVWRAAQFVTRSKVRGAGEDGPEVIGGVIEVFSTLHQRHGLMQKIVDEAQKRGTRVIRWCLLDVLEKCAPTRSCETCSLLPECKGVAKTKGDGFFSIDDAVLMKSRTAADSWETEMLCLRPSVKQSVFPTFDRALHVKDEVRASSESELWVGIDFGFSNPFVALWVRRYSDGTVHVLDEYVQSGQTMDRHIVELRQRGRGAITAIGCDPAGSATNDQTAQSNVELLRKAGFSVRTRGSKIQEGLEHIRRGLKTADGRTSLFVHSRCALLIKAMEAYRYPDGPGEVPVKDNENDHLVDALRYFFVNSGVKMGLEGGRRY